MDIVERAARAQLRAGLLMTLESPAARALLAYLKGPQARKVIEAYGYTLPTP